MLFIESKENLKDNKRELNDNGQMWEQRRVDKEIRTWMRTKFVSCPYNWRYKMPSLTRFEHRRRSFSTGSDFDSSHRSPVLKARKNTSRCFSTCVFGDQTRRWPCKQSPMQKNSRSSKHLSAIHQMETNPVKINKQLGLCLKRKKREIQWTERKGYEGKILAMAEEEKMSGW